MSEEWVALIWVMCGLVHWMLYPRAVMWKAVVLGPVGLFSRLCIRERHVRSGIAVSPPISLPHIAGRKRNG